MSDWRSMMVHRFTLQKGAVSTTADPYNPGSGNRQISFAAPAATTAGLWGLLQRVGLKEQASAGMAGTTIGTHMLYMDKADAPAGLVDFDSTPAPEVLYRVVSVARDNGEAIDAGPFDVERVTDLAGWGDVLQLELKRVN
jgi:hypothetical protein